MDLTHLAQFGEFIGGVAVLVTLVYLALQLRHSNQIAMAEAVRDTVQTLSTYRQMLVDEHLSGVWAKARQDEELSPKERVQIRAVMSELIYASFAGYINPRSSGGIAEADSEAVFSELVASEIGSSIVLRAAWSDLERELRAFNVTAFADAVSKRLADSP